ncbi:MAG: hypothetical protein ABI672_03315 [Vicinamibacteria bacterium]
MTPRTRKVLLSIAALTGLGSLLAVFVLNRRVDRALDVPVSNERPIELVALPERTALPFWGSEDIESVVELPGGMYVAGAFGVARLQQSADGAGLQRIDLSQTLPTRRVASLSSWRTDLVAGLDAGGLFVYRDGSWTEVRSGYGTLHVRTVAEMPAGELWIGAREGLFRMGLAERVMARLHTSPVKAIAFTDDGRVYSGGEKGLFSTQGGATKAVVVEGTEAAWVDGLAFFGRRIYAITPMGLMAEAPDGVFRAVSNGQNVGSIAAQGDILFATADPPDTFVRRFDSAGKLQLDQVPSAVRKVFASRDRVLADTQNGLAQRVDETWRILSKARAERAFGQTHVGAIAAFRRRLVIGFFDGGLSELVEGARGPAPALPRDTATMSLRPLTAAPSPVWAVNALLDAGGALHIASLRGAFRFDGVNFSATLGSGAAFSLAQTRSGVAIGFGEGVLLPEGKLLSAFHGLPGNQATALASAEEGLLVGTPSGIGYLEGRTVRWRATSGEGKLPHPWVNAILPQNGSILVGTYGGGIVRRVGSMASKGEWRPFPETEGLKINAGCLIEAQGRVYAGSDGLGLFRMTRDGSRFEPLRLALPSPRVTALFEKDGFLYIGTDEGLTRWSVDGDLQ